MFCIFYGFLAGILVLSTPVLTDKKIEIIIKIQKKMVIILDDIGGNTNET